jgi:hypothetical protein
MAARQTGRPNLKHGSDKRLLPPATEALLRRLLAEGQTQAAAAEKAGVSTDVLRARLRDQLADVPRRRPGPPKGYSGGDWHISAAEIRRRCAAIRETWPVERFLAAEVLDADRLGRIVEGGQDARFWER